MDSRYPFYNVILWSLFKPLFLRENHRQSSDQTYIQLLNRARVGLLRPQDHLLLKSRVRVHIYDTEKYPDVLRLFPRRDQVDEYNRLCQEKLSSKSYTHTAENYYSQRDWHPGLTVPEDELPQEDKYAANLCQTLILSIGSRVMLIQNINVADGLVNGILGIVTNFDFENGKITAVHVKFDASKVRNDGQTVDTSIVIEVIEREFFYKGRHIIRKTFPLQLAWATTIHKVQGASLNTAVIYLGSEIFQSAMAYVALSRVQSIDGLILCAYDPSVIRAPEDALEEYYKLRNKK